jgi:hypothetical protein
MIDILIDSSVHYPHGTLPFHLVNQSPITDIASWRIQAPLARSLVLIRTGRLSPCLSYKISRLIRRRVSRPKLTFFLKRPCFRFFCFSSRPYWCRRHILCPIAGIPARIPRLMNLSPRRLLSLPILGPTVFLPLASIYLPAFHAVSTVGGAMPPQNMPFLDSAMK